MTSCAALALIAWSGYIVILLKVLEAIFTMASRPVYALLSRHLSSFAALAVLTPIATVYVFLIANMLQRPTVPQEAFQRIWSSLHPAIQTVLPIVAAVYVGLLLCVLFKVRGVIATLYEGQGAVNGHGYY